MDNNLNEIQNLLSQQKYKELVQRSSELYDLSNPPSHLFLYYKLLGLFHIGQFYKSFDLIQSIDDSKLDDKIKKDINQKKLKIEQLMKQPKQKLTQKQINYILDFIKPFKGIPHEMAIYEVEKKKKGLEKQLQKLEIYPILIPKLKEKIIDKYYDSFVLPGTMVGIIAGQSIGEKQTQSTLNTFHSAGSSHQIVTKGVPRVEEIISTVKKPKHEISYIYLNKSESLQTIQDVMKTIHPHLVYTDFKTIYKKENIVYYNNLDDMPKWYEYIFTFDKEKNDIIKYDIKQFQNKKSIQFTLDKEKLYQNSIYQSLIIKKLNQKIDSLKNQMKMIVLPSPTDISEIHVIITDDDIKNDEQSNILIFKIIQELNTTHISGIPNIKYAFPNPQNLRLIQTSGSNLNKVFQLPFVSIEETYSNNIWEIYEILGIEAVYSYLVKELSQIMNGICFAHIKLLSSKITLSGKIKPINRYTKRSEDSGGPIGKSTFEEPLKILKQAALYTLTDPLTSVSSCILAAKESPAGSGLIDIIMSK